MAAPSAMETSSNESDSQNEETNHVSGGDLEIDGEVEIFTSSKSGPKATRHLVHEFFEKVNKTGRKCKLCKDQPALKSSNPTNLMKHLLCKHKAEHDQIISAEKERKAKKSGNSAKPVQLPFGTEKYRRNCRRRKKIDKLLGLVAAMPTCSLSFLLSNQMKELLKYLDPKYSVPKSRTKLIALLKSPLEKMKARLMPIIQAAKDISLSLDIWSQKGMTHSYIAVTGHFFCFTDSYRLTNVLLGIREIKGRHTAQVVKKECDGILDEWSIREEQIRRYITDSGSNMIAAYRAEIIFISEEDSIENETRIEENEFDSDTAVFLADPNLEEEAEEESEQSALAEIDRNIIQYDEKEKEYSLTFPKRMSCVAHDLQLVLHSTVDRHLQTNATVKSMMEVLRKFRVSILATGKLLSKCQLSVLVPAKTRWNSLYIVLERVIKIQDSLNQVCLEMRWTSLSGIMQQLEALKNLLKPFYEYTNFLQAEKYVTLSSVLPTLNALLFGLEKAENDDKFDCLGSLVSDIRTELLRRFQKVLQPSFSDFDPTYAVTSLLDPNNAWMLEEDFLETSKEHLANMARQFHVTEQVDSTETQSVSASAENSPLESSILLMSDYAKAIAQKKRKVVSEDTKDDLVTQISNYLTEVSISPPSQKYDLYDYWTNAKQKYGSLSNLAFSLLSIPATSAPVERVFSQAGISTAGRKNRTGPKLLQAKLMLKMNMRFVD